MQSFKPNDLSVRSLFLKSALDRSYALHSMKEVRAWIHQMNESIEVAVHKIPFSSCRNWVLDNNKSALRHESGKFFSIEGIRVTSNLAEFPGWDQPIINQPEIGYLGFITKTINGVLHFLAQGKIEPGNVNHVQISPTLQATKSNYTKVHQGKAPAYLTYFQQARNEQILLDQLQSEQGARFLKKRNRNIIIHVDDEPEVLSNFIWLTLAQLKWLMQSDNLVNMDARTVISGIPFGTDDFENDQSLLGHTSQLNRDFLISLMEPPYEKNNFDSLIHFMTKAKCNAELNVVNIPLGSVRNWNIEADRIVHEEGKYFSVIATDVTISSREVSNWCQPMIEPAQQGLCAFVAKRINGVIHLIVQAKLECGNFDIIELAPTVQCLTGNYQNEKSISTLPFLQLVLSAQPDQIVFDVMQSEEGGRFFREQNRNLLVFAPENMEEELPEGYIWMNLKQVQTFIQFNNYFNIQARNLLATLSFTDEYA